MFHVKPGEGEKMNAEDVKGICRRLMGKNNTSVINGAIMSPDGTKITVSYIHPRHYNTIRVRIQKKNGHRRAKTFKIWQTVDEVRSAIVEMLE